ncbi:MAG: rhomboid family intramembrane serine protease [Bacteroidales bacterium]|jgi:membrane associated rhomboid family serine protease|nr:rhomboid family intramembrane serine protease [Bacteroidales bacterium]
MTLPNDNTIEKKRIFYALVFPLLFVAILSLVFVVEHSFNLDFTHYGVLPRKAEGLWGIILSPFLHSSAMHLFSNSVPLVVLGWCLVYFYRDLGYKVFPLLWLLSGVFTWFIGRNAWHIGASGLTYSLAFFLFFSGILRRHIPLMAVSLIVVFLYGSIVWAMFPVAEIVDPAISWEGHLSGAISGLCCALLFRKQGPQKPIIEEEPEEEDEESPQNPSEGELEQPYSFTSTTTVI